MKRLSRREILKAAALAPAAAACGPPPSDRPPEDEPAPLGPYDAPGTEDGALFPAGIIIGDARPDGALASVLTDEATVSLVVLEATATAWNEVARFDDLASSDGSAQARVSGLKADTRYSAVAYAASGERRTAVTAFRTALAADASRVIRFGATSCLGGNLPWTNLSHVAARELDFFCLLGDTIYADGYTDGEIPGLWRTALAVQGLRDVTTRTSVVATWDDHEVTNNWSYATAGMEARVEAARAALHAALPIDAGQGPLGIYRKLSWGQTLDLFVLDSRGERRDGNYLSVEQMEWFKRALSESTARFKIVLNSVPMTDLADLIGDLEATDRWQGYPVQRTEILEHIAGEAITGVLWLSGDFHLGAIGKVDVTGGPAAQQFEILCGPSGSDINPGIGFINPNERIPIIIGEHNAVWFEADPDAGTVHVVVINDDDAVIADELLTIV